MPASNRKTQSPPAHRRILNTYLDEAGQHQLLDAEAENKALRDLRMLRNERVRAIFSCASAVPGLMEDLAARFGDALAAPTADARRHVDRLRRDMSDDAASALERSIGRLCDALVSVDPDGVWEESIHARLTKKSQGATALHGDDLDFLAGTDEQARQRYIERVEKTHEHYIGARNRFLCKNLRLVVTIAQRYGRTRMALSDRVQEGNLGLLKAVPRFDPDRGVRFSTYAAWWIRHAVTRALVNFGRTVRIPAYLHTIFTKARRARRLLQTDLGRAPTTAEIAAEIGVPEEKVQIAIEAMEQRSIGMDAPTAGGGSLTEADVLEDERPDQQARRIEALCDVGLAMESLGCLDEMELDIVERRFGLHGKERASLRAIGEIYELSRERIRQLQNRALSKLQEAMESSPIPGLAYA